ncbi:MAG TPA: 4-hydroxyphenylpyruvate dioxygenase [Pyrinomonadaceae bacterium]
MLNTLDAAVMAQPECHLPSQIKGIDYIEFYVGNAHQAAHFYRSMYGFDITAYAGLETGDRDRVSYLLEQGDIRLMLTSALSPRGPVSDHVHAHGDGVKDIALRVEDAAAAFEWTVSRGARPVSEPEVFEDEGGQSVRAVIGVFGDTVHTLLQRDSFGPARPGFVPLPNLVPVRNPAPVIKTGLDAVDHVAISVPYGELDVWVEFYQEVLGFHQSHREDVCTEYSAMNSKVVQSPDGSVKFPIVEPAPGKRKSQVQEHLEFYGGAGVQHVAFLTEGIIDAVRALRANGNEFLGAPDTYYGMLEERISKIDEDVSLLQGLNILVDRDEWGYLMQIFTRPVQCRPTVFFEVIQRKLARGFGGGNIKALFEAKEREQALRGNL